MEEYMIIRGKRILNQLEDPSIVEYLEEQSTFVQLLQNVERGFPNTTKRQDATGPVTVSALFHSPAVGMKTLTVLGHTRTQLADRSGENIENRASIAFNGVVFEPESTNENITVTTNTKQEVSFQQIDLSQHTVRVRCTCEDFFWRFAAYNAIDKSLIGKAPPPYQRKTNQGPSNPMKVPGVCKHLIKVFEKLKENNAVR